jgi:hypothetical protein
LNHVLGQFERTYTVRTCPYIKKKKKRINPTSQWRGYRSGNATRGDESKNRGDSRGAAGFVVYGQGRLTRYSLDKVGYAMFSRIVGSKVHNPDCCDAGKRR